MILCVFSSPLRVDQQAPLCDLVIGSTDGACTWADQLSDFLWPLPEVLDYPAKFGPGLANVDLHQLSLSTLSLSLSLISVYWSLGHIYFLYPAPLPNLAEGRKFLNPLVVKFLEMCSFFIAHLSSSLSMDWRRPWQWKLVFYIFDVLPPSPIWQRAGSFHPLSLSLISVYWSLGHIYFLYPAPLPNLAEGRKFLNPLVVKTLEMHSFFISHLSSSLSMDWRRPWLPALVWEDLWKLSYWLNVVIHCEDKTSLGPKCEICLPSAKLG